MGAKTGENSDTKERTDRLRLLQLTELEILIEFDRICRKYKIGYTIIGGTLLGSVRHKGFVPWDDDADVAMLRADYEKFVKACKVELDKERFYFQDQFRTREYRWGYGKLRRRKTAFVRPNTEHLSYEQGVYIDVMPLDYVPDNKAGQVICNVIAFLFRKAAWSEVGKRTDPNPVYRALYRLLDRIPLQRQNTAYRKFIRRLNRKPTKYLRCLAVPIVRSEGDKGYWRYKTEWMYPLKEYEFEGYSFLGMKDGRLALKRMYGDYMKPVKFPPVSVSSCILPPLEEIQVDERLKETNRKEKC